MIAHFYSDLDSDARLLSIKGGAMRKELGPENCRLRSTKTVALLLSIHSHCFDRLDSAVRAHHKSQLPPLFSGVKDAGPQRGGI